MNDKIADVPILRKQVQDRQMKAGRLLILLFVEAVMIVAVSGSIVTAYWLKARYYPGPTYAILTVGVLVAAILGGVLVTRGPARESDWAWPVSVMAGAVAGAITLLLSTGFIVSLLGS